METRVYAIKETEDVHEISNEDFINQAEDLGYVWSLLGFQNELNCEGSYVGLIPLVDRLKNMNLHFRFIDVPTEENELSDLEWLRKFASYISDKWNEAYNDASKFADSNNDDVYTLQCDEADTDGLKNKCFCDDCGEYVETSECTMNDYTENVDGIEVDVSEVLCNTCNENKDETPSMAKIQNLLDSATRPMNHKKEERK